MKHPCKNCPSAGRNSRDPAYECDECDKVGDYEYASERKMDALKCEDKKHDRITGK